MKYNLKIIRDSYSVVGTKECHISDEPQSTFAFSDTGGIFGDKKDHYLSSAEFASSTTAFICKTISGDKYIAFSVKLKDGSVVCSFSNVKQILLFLQKIYPGETYPTVYLPAKLKESDARQLDDVFDNLDMDYFPTGESDIRNDFEKNNILPIAFSLKNNRLTFHTLHNVSTDIPIDQLKARVEGQQVIFASKIVLGDAIIDGFVLEFPQSDLATEFVNRFCLVQEPVASDPTVNNNGLISHVNVEGIVAGRNLSISRCDALLTDNKLTLSSADISSGSLQINFSNDDVAVDGTSDSFVLSDRHGTLISISASSGPFHRAIQNNRLLQLAANRSANIGPFVAIKDSKWPVRIETIPEGLRFSGGGDDEVILTLEMPPRLEWIDSKPCLRLGNVVLEAQIPMLEGIAAAAATPMFLHRIRSNFRGGVSSLIGLEGKYFAYSTVGRLAEAHLVLSQALNTQQVSNLSELNSPYEQSLLVAFMAQNASRMARDLEAMINFLPAFMANNDNRLLEALNLSTLHNSRNMEAACQRALSAVAPLVSHFYRLDSYTAKFYNLRKNLKHQNGWSRYIPLGVSAAAALTLNPIAWVGVVQQSASLLSQTGARESMEESGMSEAFTNCAEEWTHIINSLLPFAAYRFSQDIYPVRLSLAALLLSAHEKANETERERIEYFVARRLAKISTFLDFPLSLEKNLTREDAVDFIFRLQTYAIHPDLRNF